MDTSEEYILMCEKAAEVQEGWKLDDGDITVDKEFSFTGVGYEQKEAGYSVPSIHCFDCNPKMTKEQLQEDGLIWLPRQDQLLNIISNDFIWQSEILRKWFDGEICSNWPLKSMEQVCLTIVMKEKYNKVWTGTDWQPAGRDNGV